jgi:endonuclease/exonuclease/phosphatase family metal-dependent hydrolase
MTSDDKTMKTKGRYETSNDRGGRADRPAANGPSRFATAILLTIILAAAVPTVPAGPPGVGGQRGVGTMNANLFVGGGIDRVIALDPTDPAYLSNLVFTVTGVYYQIVASQPDVRLQGVADRIAARMPDLVAVQEASLIRNQSPGDLVVGGSTPATNVVYDYLAILVEALKARGAHYAVVSSIEEADVEMPMLNLQTGEIDDARLTDRDAILVRTDLPPGQLRVSNPQGSQFTYMIELPTVKVPRGWCSVDVFVRGEKFRYVCAHLEVETVPQIQMLQAVELMDLLANVNVPVILSGDFNSDPLYRTGTQTYDVFGAAGFADAWGTLNEANPAGGLTWGHDEFLADPTIPFIWRLDLVLYRGNGLIPIQSEVLDLTLNRVEPPLWASDHVAVTANFRLQEQRPPKSPPHGANSRAPFSR